MTTEAHFVHPKPASVTYAEAATLPFAFMTAHYALTTVGHLQSGERVLIHAGAGGVGMAAIQLAKHIGAEIFATAGSPEKRAYLRSLGVAHVFDSRSLSFSEEIPRKLRVAQGSMLSSTHSRAISIPASVAVLNERGRFLEIGKRDIWTDAQIPRGPPERKLYRHRSERTARYSDPTASAALFTEVLDMIDAGTIAPLPFQAFPLERAADAFRFMAQAKHIGKIVLTEAGLEQGVLGNVTEQATYLITGGLTGLRPPHRTTSGRTGRSASRARRTACARRSHAQHALQQLAAKGAQIVVRQTDVSDAAQIASVIDEIDGTMPPLRPGSCTPLVCWMTVPCCNSVGKVSQKTARTGKSLGRGRCMPC